MKKGALGLILLTAAVLVCFGCTSPLVTGEGQQGYGSLRLSLVQEGARTLMPQVVQHIRSYSISLSPPGEGSVLEKEFSLGEALHLGDIPVGTYILNVFALNSQALPIVKGKKQFPSPLETTRSLYA